MTRISSILAKGLVASHAAVVAGLSTLKVDTSSGEVVGMINGSTPAVAQFMGIPFAEPPLDSLRFLPPQPKLREQETINATFTRPVQLDPKNYRNNIFGFPNARYLADNGTNVNMGLLDQRTALEWTRDNIGAFGGDASCIVIWGQSSGSASTDFYNYAYPEDPIVAGLIQHSGSVFATGVAVDSAHQNFTFVAQSLGCGNATTAEDEFRCMQTNVSADAIIDLYGQYNLNHSSYQLKWTTITDNVTKWDNYTARAYAGNYTKVTSIAGSNGNEDASLISFPGVDGPNITEVREKVRTGRTCPVTYLSNLRYDTGARTFRYWNNASFPNISPLWWEGAYHTSELGLLFGTYIEYGVGPATEFEHQVADTWQDFYLAFIKDPTGDGLIEMGWPTWAPDAAEAVMVFGQDGVASQLWNATWFETQCEGVAITTGTNIVM
ncbi:hypothetical protein Daus18300_006454 [Diaporthe australafricana]|uniref:Carboxylic ester hydrolase n=1 Tax=Diaporthe australafricana TaxID=127596 RepID=A0ABR3WUM1_9PEZI